jgi:hypothetical protein
VKKLEGIFAQTVKYPTTKQIKLHILRHLQWRFMYLVATIPDSTWTMDLMGNFEIELKNTLCCIFSLPKSQMEGPALHVRLFSCPEDGGMGLLPFASLRKYIHERTLKNANNLMVELGNAIFNGPSESHTIKYIWRRVMQPELSALDTTEKLYCKSWLDTWPSRPLLKLTDEACECAVWYRLGKMRPFPFICAQLGRNLGDMSPEECLTHTETCKSCGGMFFHVRHEKVNDVIHKTFRWHNVQCILNPKDLPLPNNNKGGPDFVVYCGSDVYCGDVAVTKGRTGMIYASKMRTYEQFAELTSMITFPFVMSVLGSIDYKTLVTLKTLANKTQSPLLVADMVANVQFELLRGLYTATVLQKARGSLPGASKGSNAERDAECDVV